MLAEHGTRWTSCSTSVDEDEVVQRLSGRRTCRNECGARLARRRSTRRRPRASATRCGGELYQRADDTEETSGTARRSTAEQTAPLIDFYSRQGILVGDRRSARSTRSPSARSTRSGADRRLARGSAPIHGTAVRAAPGHHGRAEPGPGARERSRRTRKASAAWSRSRPPSRSR